MLTNSSSIKRLFLKNLFFVFSENKVFGLKFRYQKSKNDLIQFYITLNLYNDNEIDFDKIKRDLITTLVQKLTFSTKKCIM